MSARVSINDRVFTLDELSEDALGGALSRICEAARQSDKLPMAFGMAVERAWKQAVRAAPDGVASDEDKRAFLEAFLVTFERAMGMPFPA